MPPLPEDVNIYINGSNSNYDFINNARPSMYVTSAITILLGLSGVAAFIYLLWGGFQWITAGGDKDAVEKARRRIITALIGLAVVFSAYAIIFILKVLFNITIIEFTLNRLNTY